MACRWVARGRFTRWLKPNGFLDPPTALKPANAKAVVPKFLADAMLRRLCRWLRILGYSCDYASPEKSDDEVIRWASGDKLVLLTRDEELAQKARDYCKTLLLRSNYFQQQAKEVFRSLRLAPSKFPSRTICPECNGLLRKTSKAEVEGKVWPYVFKRRRDFWECTGCGKIYWKGSHWRGIKKTVERIRRKKNGR
ncbi:MAG: Mut7-C RNAse domain-containing protein [Candidatus Micrarchaeota archaeon]